MSHLRLVHPRRPMLTREQLTLFATPKTWAEILEIEPRMSGRSWRDAVIDADEMGFGLLRWIPGESRRRVSAIAGAPPPRKGTWTLTPKGRAHVARGTRNP